MNIEEINLNLKEGHAVCFDFDGVIHTYDEGWKDGSIYGKLNVDMIMLMSILQNFGVPVFICSTRESKQIINWLENLITLPVKKIEDETFWNDTKVIGVTNRKLPAQLYIDDRAYRYTGQSVKEILKELGE